MEAEKDQLDVLSEQVGQPLPFYIYCDGMPVAQKGHIITENLLLKVAQMDRGRLRFSRDKIGDADSDDLELIENEIKPNFTSLCEDAGVVEDLSEAARMLAMRKVKEVFEACRYLTKLDLDAIVGLATELIQRVVSLDSSAFKLHDLRHYDEYTYYHSVNVCVLGTTLFKEHIPNEQELLDFGIGLLLHDIGKSKVDLKILNKPAELTEEERYDMRRHVIYGYNLVKSNKSIATLSKNVILSHHERVDGRGYTRKLTEAELSFFDMAAAICDVFDAVTTNRVYRAKMDVHRAVSLLISGAGTQFNTRLVNRFLRGIGRFPVGTFVVLSSGETGIVSRINASALSLPVIKILFDSSGSRLGQPRTVDLYRERGVFIERPLDLNHATPVATPA
jgi:HD-GYP domain-containing protein (c-di-GMP phosphodiesterase class II)